MKSGNKTKDVVRQFLAGGIARSVENAKAFDCLYSSHCYIVCIGLMRQELDTLLRLAFLWRPETDSEIAIELMRRTVTTGKKWSYQDNGKTILLTDKKMLEFAHFLGGWEKIAYAFGCKAIHLSDLHGYQISDPFEKADLETKSEIIKYLSIYHGYGENDLIFEGLVEYLPQVMEKISANVNFYYEELNERYLNS